MKLVYSLKKQLKTTVNQIFYLWFKVFKELFGTIWNFKFCLKLESLNFKKLCIYLQGSWQTALYSFKKAFNVKKIKLEGLQKKS